MSRTLIDLTGRTIGRWTVVRRDGFGDRQPMWLCQCSCGSAPVRVAGQSLRGGVSLSCGCLRGEQVAKRNRRHGLASRAAANREYWIWKAMWDRCRNPKNAAYGSYGGRGITVDPAWKSFEQFLADMGPRPTRYTLERKDVNGPYAPWNCVWASYKTQSINRRNNRRITCAGLTLTVSEWAEASGQTAGRLTARLDRGWSPVIALAAPRSGGSASEADVKRLASAYLAQRKGSAP